LNTVTPSPCDVGVAAAIPSAITVHPAATLAATILGSSLAFIDGSVVNVALPAIQHDLGAKSAMLSWAVNAYLLPVGALTLIGGGIGDEYGRRKFFLAGIYLFAAASILCASAPDFGWLLAGRALQGIGAALLMPNSLAILGASFEGEAQGKAIGTWAAVGAVAGAVGPLVGGWLIGVAGWRSIFLLNLPIAAAAGYLVHRFVRESRSSDAGSLDWVGAIVATTGLAAITASLTKAAGEAQRSQGIAWWGVAGLGALGCFLWLERRRGENALMPLSLFATATFAGLTLLTFFVYASLGGLVVLLPYLLIRVGDYSAMAAGAAMLPLPIAIGLGSRVIGRITARHGARWPLTIGASVVACGLALYQRIGHSIVYWTDIFPPTLLVAIGMTIIVAPLTASVMSSVNQSHVGIASGFNSAVARVGGLFATALVSFVFASQGSAAALLAGFREASLVGATLAAMAAVSSLALVRAQAIS
jgi:EmrB/QacA subfamily drug resistance transporter